MELDKKIKQDIGMIVESLGLKVYDIEYTASKISIFIEREDGNVSIKDCEEVSKNVSVMLDVNDPINHPYTLEVSSPGINRRLRKREHFLKAIGKKCYVRTHRAVDLNKVFRGILESYNDNSIVVKTDNGNIEIELSNIKKARVDEI